MLSTAKLLRATQRCRARLNPGPLSPPAFLLTKMALCCTQRQSVMAAARKKNERKKRKRRGGGGGGGGGGGAPPPPPPPHTPAAPRQVSAARATPSPEPSCASSGSVVAERRKPPLRRHCNAAAPIGGSFDRPRRAQRPCRAGRADTGGGKGRAAGGALQQTSYAFLGCSFAFKVLRCWVS